MSSARSASTPQRISVVVPVHNEANNLAPLHAELQAILTSLTDEFEIIYVDDGSTDSSLAELSLLKGATIISLNRCYGQATALDAGFKAATGDLIISIDGDGQNDPADIPRLLEKMHAENLDVVAGWRKVRSDKRGIRLLTKIGRAFRHALINDPVHDTGCTLRVYTREAAKSLDLGGEMHRYILALLRWKGFMIGELEVRDRARVNGVSKYGYGKAVRGLIDLIYVWFIHKYSDRPLHLFGYLSLSSFALGTVAFFFVLYDRLILGLHINRDGWFFLMFFLYITAIMLFSFGIIIDLLMRIYLNTSPSEKSYYIRTVTHT
jgi:glycosyltransferase involved in cell wall biosynthesis